MLLSTHDLGHSLRIRILRILKHGTDFTFMHFTHHRREVAQPCVNGDQLSQWRMAKKTRTASQNFV